MSNFVVRKVAVLGAGVMGAQIAAHCANVGIPVLLFDLPTRVDGSLGARLDNENAIVDKALAGLKKLEPAPLASSERLSLIQAANYGHDLGELWNCDLVIEAIAEKPEWKTQLYRQVAPWLAPHAVFATNTSGLSINLLAEGFPENLRHRFCGVHFFNPPRYMPLVELIACHETEPDLLDALETFLTSTLGKSVVRALDSPNFIANRIGVFSMLATIHHTQRLGLGFDEVDALTGTLIGRPKSATYRTADVVGLDTLAHVIATMTNHLHDDPWAGYFAMPAWMTALIEKGALGQKSGAGIYRKEGKQIRVLDLSMHDYRESHTGDSLVTQEIREIMSLRDPAERFAQLRSSQDTQARFLWSVFCDVFHYVAYHLVHIAHNARDVDLAMRWGFGWTQGPFEIWQAAGWQAMAEALREDMQNGLTMVDANHAPLPAWVFHMDGVHAPLGSYSASSGLLEKRPELPVYRRQLFPERVLGEAQESSHTLWENDEVRLWLMSDFSHRDADLFGRRVALLSFKSRMNAIGPKVLDGIIEAVQRAEADYAGLVIWQPNGPFSVGANLKQIRPIVEAGDFKAVEDIVVRFQEMTQVIKYAQVPVVVAVNGLALGGGCEIVMHAARVVASLESYIGLVEAGVGLIPAGGGCKEFAVRCARRAAGSANPDAMLWLQGIFQNVAMATMAKSALQAKEMGFMRQADIVLAHPQELLYVACQTALAMSAAAYRPPLKPTGIAVAGRGGIANLDMMLVNMREGGFISDHDYRVSHAIAMALCGGEVESGTKVSEKWLLEVERAQFMALLKTEQTLARIAHMLETGKPLRN